MRQPKILRTSTFQLALIYALLFAGSVLILMYFMHWATVGYMERQTEETIDAEITGLQDQFEAQGLNGLARAINERTADPTSSALYLFATPDFAPLAGNLAAWPALTPEPGGWSSRELLSILEGLEGLNVIGGDVVEVAPVYDTVGETTALVAADIAHTIVDLMVANPVLTPEGRKG